MPTVVHRDVYILDRYNSFYHKYNLSDNPIDGNSAPNTTNRQTLKNMLIAAATHVDADADGLPDDWEQAQFGSLAQSPDTQASNGSSVLYTFALSQKNASLDGNADPICSIEPSGNMEGHLTYRFRRRQGLVGGLTYAVEMSDDLQTWMSASADFIEPVPSVPLYDGSGTELITLQQIQPLSGAPARRSLRLRISRP